VSAKPCTSHRRDVRPSVCPSHADTEWKRCKLDHEIFTDREPKDSSFREKKFIQKFVGFTSSEGVKWEWGISETVQDRTKVTINDKQEVAYALWIGAKINDLGWPWTAVAEKMRLLEPTTKIWMKIDPCHQQQKCIPMTLVSGGMRFVRIFTKVTQGGASNDSGGVDNGFFAGYCLNTLEMRPALLYADMQSVVGLSVIQKWMTLNDCSWLFFIKFYFRTGLAGWDRATSKNIAWKLIKIDTYCIWCKSSARTLVSGSIKFMRVCVGVL